MILYNTLMGVCAGGIMILVAQALRTLSLGRKTLGHGPALLALGIPLAVLAGAMTLTWPLTVNAPINIAFGEPALMLGVLATIAGWILTRLSVVKATSAPDVEVKLDIGAAMKPIQWVIFFVGLILASTSSAIFSYNLVGDAPPNEPITGQFTGWENTFFALLYLCAAVGCLLAPWLRTGWHRVNQIVFATWMLSGILFLAFSALNYRTHIGLLINIERGTNYKW
jgi:uncharacterized membrane protein